MNDTQPENGTGARVDLLDAWKSVCLCVMVGFHLCYDLTLFGRFPAEVMTCVPARVITYVFGGMFILLSGALSRRARNNVRRGFTLLLWGLAVTAVTVLLKMPVAFGILHLLGVCKLLYGAAARRHAPRGGPGFALCCAALFAVSWLLTARVTVPVRWLYFLGLRPAGYWSADDWPLLPWACLFLLGTALGARISARRDAPLLRAALPAWLTFPGRHSLAVYLLHQPLLYGACLLLFHT
jgi:uncharacterized membrane protein